MPVPRSSAISWQDIDMLGEYDFSKKLHDIAGVKPPRLTP
jgi:hypothetical protein